MTIGPKGKRVQFILLDTRYFRSPLKRAAKREKGKGPYAPNESDQAEILGENPMEVVGENFAQTGRSPHHCIQYSSCFNHSRLGNLGKLSQRTETLDLLNKTKANGVIILSGDRHSSEISKLSYPLPYPFRGYVSHELKAEAPSRRKPASFG